MNCIKLQLLGISVQFFVDRQIANVIKNNTKMTTLTITSILNIQEYKINNSFLRKTVD